uniref:Uncharacterized protein n=1 Tax=Neogobius melanostomus TaxID=47308 RepID=A0A8C6SXC4_9GOBI
MNRRPCLARRPKPNPELPAQITGRTFEQAGTRPLDMMAYRRGNGAVMGGSFLGSLGSLPGVIVMAMGSGDRRSAFQMTGGAATRLTDCQQNSPPAPPLLAERKRCACAAHLQAASSNCGSLLVSDRKTGHQICSSGKCEELKKKREAARFGKL